MKLKTAAALAALGLGASLAAAQNSNQGVSKDEITLGSIQDLSGPIAGFGKQVRLGMLLRVDEINEQGGINGRKVSFISYDDGYSPPRTVEMVRKLVEQDRVLFIFQTLGTPSNTATAGLRAGRRSSSRFPVPSAGMVASVSSTLSGS